MTTGGGSLLPVSAGVDSADAATRCQWTRFGFIRYDDSQSNKIDHLQTINVSLPHCPSTTHTQEVEAEPVTCQLPQLPAPKPIPHPVQDELVSVEVVLHSHLQDPDPTYVSMDLDFFVGTEPAYRVE